MHVARCLYETGWFWYVECMQLTYQIQYPANQILFLDGSTFSNVHCYTFCLFNLDMQAIITWGHQTFSQCAEKIYLQSSIGCSDIPFSLQSTLQKVMDHLTVSSFAIVETVKFAIHTSDTPNVCGACCCYLRQNGQKTYLITPERVCSPEQTTFQQ